MTPAEKEVTAITAAGKASDTSDAAPSHADPSDAVTPPGAPQGFAIEVFGRVWWVDTSATTPEFSESLEELWSSARPSSPFTAEPYLSERASPAAPATPFAPGKQLRIFVTPPGMPQPQPRDAMDYPTTQPRDEQDAAYAVSRSITFAGIQQRTGEAMMLHAVGVASDEGRLVALVGKSGTGKTTAARLLGQHLGYVTDETVVIESDQSIAPYAKPLSVVHDSTDGTRKTEHSPAALGLRQRPETVTLAAIVVLVRDPEVSEPILEPIGIAEAMLALLPETSALAKLPNSLDTFARVLVSHGGPYRLTYAEIGDCVDLIRNLTVPHPERDASAPRWVHYPGTGIARTDEEDVELAIAVATEPPPLELQPSSVIARDDWDDGIESEGEIVLLRGSSPVYLGGVGSTTWMALEHPLTLKDLHDRIVATIGDHPRSWDLVQQAVELLNHQRLVTVDAHVKTTDAV